MNQYQRIEKINQCLREYATPAVGTAVKAAAKNSFLQQLLIQLGISTAADFLSKKEVPDKPYIKGPSVSLQQSGSSVTPVRGGLPPSSNSPRTFATVRGRQVYPGRR